MPNQVNVLSQMLINNAVRFAYDGSGNRIGFIDEDGNVVQGVRVLDTYAEVPNPALAGNLLVPIWVKNIGHGAPIIADGSRWRLFNGRAVLKSGVDIITHTGSTAKTILEQCTIPRHATYGSLMKDGDQLVLTQFFYKTTSSFGTKRSFFFGKNGTTGDAEIDDFSGFSAAANKGFDDRGQFFIRTSSTTIKKYGVTGTANGGTSTSFEGATATVPNMDSNDLIISSSYQLENAVDVGVLRAWRLELVTCGA